MDGPMDNYGDGWNEDMGPNDFQDYPENCNPGPGPGPGYYPPRFGGPGGRGRQGRFGPPPGYGPFMPGPGFFHPDQQFSWGRGFGPNGPPTYRHRDNKPLKHLIRCGVAKEHLKNLPRDLLQLIDPQYCGLCAVALDSFELSRVHYISKNHLKNQKKWLLHYNEMGSGNRRAREIPLKSRDLYCELCDVHITSKAHADSHYAGKPHRAIVEGRKKPKNPMLLQKGMQERVDQLIRREKKNYKYGEENKEDVTEELKEVKITPELYCDICKTSVTCSEQMTMHLNGKRHLTKEKQHILTMMKGEKEKSTAKPDDAKEDVEDTAEEGADQTEQVQEGQHQEGQNQEEELKGDEAAAEDWENGDGNWDEML